MFIVFQKCLFSSSIINMSRLTLAALMMAVLATGVSNAQEVRSLESSIPVTFEVENAMPAPLDLLWVDFEGVEQDYGTIGPGEIWDIQTYATHVWVFKQNGEEVDAYIIGRKEHQSLTISMDIEASLAYGDPANVTFANDTSQPMQVIWVDFQGTELDYGVVPPGQNWSQPTGAGHIWRFKQDGQLVGSYVVTNAGDQSYTVRVGEQQQIGSADFATDSTDPRIQFSPDGFSLPDTPINLWSRAELYDLEKSQSVTLEFEVMLKDTASEVIIAFSQNRVPWGGEGPDALTIRTTWEEDVWFRTGFYENWLDYELGDEDDIINLDQWQRYSVVLGRKDVTIHVDGKLLARAKLGGVRFPAKGHIGFIVYGSEARDLPEISYRNISVKGGLQSEKTTTPTKQVEASTDQSTQDLQPSGTGDAGSQGADTPASNAGDSRGVRPVTSAAGGGGVSNDLTNPGRFYALMIAVEKYEDPKINSLNFPVQDAQNIINTLTSDYTFDSQDIVFLKNPTKDQIVLNLESLEKKVSANDNLLIFYAGHGVWDKKLEQGFWLPTDAKEGSRVKWLSNGTIKEYVKGISSKHTLLISDACFSGGIFKTRSAFNTTADKATTELYKTQSRKAMTSGSLKEVPDKSVFIQYLIKKLKENPESFMAAQSLFTSLRGPVTNNSPNEQVPQFGVIRETGDEDGEFIFIRRQQ